MNQSSDESGSDAERFHIEFFLDQVEPECLSDVHQAKWRAAIRATLEREQVGQAEISVAIVSGPRMQQLNRQYLQHDYDTDVLSFCLEEEQELGFLLGQLVVSLDYARQQAANLALVAGSAVEWSDELALYLVHGTLHLVGYEDQEPDDRQEMRAAEKSVLAGLGIQPIWPPDEHGEVASLRPLSEKAAVQAVEPQT